jgi:hypothetical protein
LEHLNFLLNIHSNKFSQTVYLTGVNYSSVLQTDSLGGQLQLKGNVDLVL